MFDVLEHIYPKDHRAVLTDIHRVLKTNAPLVIVSPFDHAYDDGIQHVAFFDEESISAIVSTAGYKVERSERDRRPDMHTPLGHDRLVVVARAVR